MFIKGDNIKLCVCKLSDVENEGEKIIEETIFDNFEALNEALNMAEFDDEHDYSYELHFIQDWDGMSMIFCDLNEHVYLAEPFSKEEKEELLALVSDSLLTIKEKMELYPDEIFDNYIENEKPIKEGESRFCPKCWNLIDECTCKEKPKYNVNIDDGLVNIIVNLNKKGYRTVYCCEGHYSETETEYIGGYITFYDKYKLDISGLDDVLYDAGATLRWRYKAATKNEFEKNKKKKLKNLEEWAESLLENKSK